MSKGFERRGFPNVPLKEKSRKEPGVDITLTQAEARASGYTGNVCEVCGSPRMRVAGHCMVCEECGSTTGCS